MKTHMLVTAFTVALAGCGKPAPAPQPPTTDTGSVPAGVTDGALWTCQIEDYDAQPCKFHKEEDGWHISKLMGSQRFTGVVAFGAEGMELAGEFFCPWGECTADVHTTLTGDESGAYTGEIDGSPVKVWWD
jgi:hypothetical protein